MEGPVPINVPPQLPVYHFHSDASFKEPFTNRVPLVLTQIGLCSVVIESITGVRCGPSFPTVILKFGF
jgi:hypothetical protein